jgi:hypothetical protein
MVELLDTLPVREYILENWDDLWDETTDMFCRGSAVDVSIQFPQFSLQQIKYRLRMAREEHITVVGHRVLKEPTVILDIPPFSTQTHYDNETATITPLAEEIPESVHDLITGVYADKADGVLNTTEIRLMALCAELMFEVDRLTFELDKVRR